MYKSTKVEKYKSRVVEVTKYKITKVKCCSISNRKQTVFVSSHEMNKACFNI